MNFEAAPQRSWRSMVTQITEAQISNKDAFMPLRLPIISDIPDTEEATTPIGLLGSIGLAIVFVALSIIVINLLLLPVPTI
jgi:hypothetical protein